MIISDSSITSDDINTEVKSCENISVKIVGVILADKIMSDNT
jgi:hypothetical protein